MSDSELHTKLMSLMRWFDGMGVRPAQKDLSFWPANPEPRNENLGHIYWLVTQALSALLSSRRLDAERYFGFASGVLWWCGMGPDHDGLMNYEHKRTVTKDRWPEDQNVDGADKPVPAEV